MTRSLRWPLAVLATGALACVAASAQPVQQLADPPAQQPAQKPAQNVFQFSATGQVLAAQDWLSVTLSVQREGADATAVQAELQRVLDAALQQIRPGVEGDKLSVQTGSFGVYPSYQKNRPKGWTGRAELLLQGNDFARILQAAERASGMSIAHMDFSLSRQARRKLEQQAQAEAIERFKARAQDIVKAFGLSGYTLGEITISGDADPYGADMHAAPMFSRKASAAMDESAAMLVEPGQARVQVTVSGSVYGR